MSNPHSVDLMANSVAEYKVRPVTRYIVTRFKSDGISASSTQFGEFDTQHAATVVAQALCGAEPGALLSSHLAGDPASV